MPNRLAEEASPYLQQHANNPVDWYPWGPEALARARNEDRPIFLSIGYSACHWCHVMERESFENEPIARLMNEWFVNVKVDREERPDLDNVYQLVVQLMGRSGGWPLTVFLTPDQKPFFGGTYFPPSDRYGLPGFPTVLQAVWEAFRARRDQVDTQAGELARAIAEVAAGEARAAGGALAPELLARAGAKLEAKFDDVHGGFGGRPKFPNTTALGVLLRAGDVARVRKALDAMRAGGIWDHLGSGFHRYSTDERWLVPHFEKMLYDNAQLLRLYADAWRVTGDAGYEATARAIASYVAREMTAPDGGFYATQDADSEGHEGRFFVWTREQVEAACGDDAEATRVALAVYDVTAEGNFEGSGATVLATPAPLAAVAGRLGMAPAAVEAALERARSRMLAERERRPRPFRDEKILASWNGLMAGALADAGAAFGDAAMVEAAAKSLSFVERSLVTRDGGTRVLRHFKDGAVRGPGFLDDHAFVGDAALDLYEATGDARWAALARELGESILAHFADREGGGFFFSPDDGESILVRAKDAYDHAVPSGASIACRLLLRLGALVDPKLGEAAVAA
ncbi:MAG TPA: thioredoxin domain-containing protein, partial [Polyangiaceae bacterium]|nr:thioredoxin domain-containing protein [Polyangiaceae bacterium]